MTFRRLALMLVLGSLSGCGPATVSDPAVSPPAPKATVAKPAADGVAPEPGGQADNLTRPGEQPTRPAGAPGPRAEQAATPEPDGGLERKARELEDALKKEPSDRAIQLRLARVTQELGQASIPLGDGKKTEDLFARSAELCHKLQDADKVQVDPLFATAFYNEACVYARRKQPEAALKSLTASVDAGLQTTRDLDNDPDLASIRDTPKFRALRERVARAAGDGPAPKGTPEPR